MSNYTWFDDDLSSLSEHIFDVSKIEPQIDPEPHILLFRRDKDPVPTSNTANNTTTNSAKDSKINGQQAPAAAGGRVGGMVA